MGNVNQAQTTYGATPLWMASQNGRVDTVKALIKAGGNVNQHNNNEATPLFMASYNGRTDVVRLLLQQPNIDMNKIAHGKSPLGYAIKKKHTELIQLLKDAGATYNIKEAIA